ncbi:hypothetical protein H6P81_005947 [Aristolochia fimbriata]|uniref:SET domain-containing protein n=1 Tax=Aristolochia fimbriata TaxID=158543 RepID=A0AAV7EWD6_ARIFI|nr:hypothetical protein H6P81_005947 [Aristolochia fimbriata]
MGDEQEAKVSQFLSWLQVNRVELRDCNIRYCGPNKGFGIFSSNNSNDGILLVVPLELAITPMRVLQDPFLGPKCRAMFEEGDVDDRFLMILFLTVERLREHSTWKPYLDMLPSTFGSSIWFKEDELSELKGTTLYRATKLQKEKLQALFEHKVKSLVEELLKEELDNKNEVRFEDFIWANTVFWTRALNLPLPRTFVFPDVVRDQGDNSSFLSNHSRGNTTQISGEMLSHGKDKSAATEGMVTTSNKNSETIWVEGLVPGIDLCNHAVRAAATWEVDGTGSTTCVPCSMYLLSAEQGTFQGENEITISYGDKGNEELLYLYGFVLENNPDDYLMVHYPIEAFQNERLADFKGQLLVMQGVEMRCLLYRRLLENGFFQGSLHKDDRNKKDSVVQNSSYSWGGRRKVPSYLSKLVFPEDFMAALRTVAMKEAELLQVSTVLQELVSRDEKQPSDTEVRTAVWETCGDSGALQLLINLLQAKLMELEEGTGTEFSDSEHIKNALIIEESNDYARWESHYPNKEVMNRNRWSAIVYRRGQKQLARLFLQEADHALELCLNEVE